MWGHTLTAPDGTYDRWAVNAKKFFDAGIDPYEVWTKRCREKGVSPWISMRMNDVHYLVETNYFRNTTFCRTRRDLRRVPESNKRGTDFALDFSHKEVRDYTFAQFREIAERWDADGVEMDWMRFCREHNPNVPFLPCLDCFELRDAAAFRALTARYRAGGAKGLYLFNAPYVGVLDSDGRKHGEDTFAIICEEGL